MYPHERSLVQRLQGRPFALLGVNCDDDREALQAVLARQNITWRCWWDGGTEGPIAAKWGVQGWPNVFVLDGHGVVRYRQVFGRALDQAVDTLLRELESGKRS